MPTRSKTTTNAKKTTFSEPTPERRTSASVPLRREDTPHPSSARGLGMATPSTRRGPSSRFVPPATTMKRKRLQRLDESSSGSENDEGDNSDTTQPDLTGLQATFEQGAAAADPEDDILTEVEDLAASDNTDNEDTPPTLKASRLALGLGEEARRTVTRAGETRAWMLFVRRVVGNPAPALNGTTKPFALFCPLLPAHHGALEMIKNTPQLAMLAVSRGGPLAYAKCMMKTFWLHHRKAKTQYNRSICDGFLANGAKFSIATNVLSSSEGPMALAPCLAHLGGIPGLVDLLQGHKLYADATFYKIWVGFHASGALYGGLRHPASSSLESMVDVNYDAYARLELIDRLSCQAFRHGHTAPYLAKRAEMFRKIRKNVRKDRLENLDLVSPLSSSLAICDAIIIFIVMPRAIAIAACDYWFCCCPHTHRPKKRGCPSCQPRVQRRTYTT